MLTKKQIEAVEDFNKEIQAVIVSGLVKPRGWQGEKDIKNPTTDEILGKQQTLNIDLPVDSKMFIRAQKMMPALKGSGYYLRGVFSSHNLVVIKARHDAIRNVDVLQFTPENSGNKFVLTTEEGVTALDKFLSQEVTSVRYTSPVTAPKPMDKVEDKVIAPIEKDDPFS